MDTFRAEVKAEMGKPSSSAAKYVTLRIGCNKAIANGTKTTIGSAGMKPFLQGGKTMVPLRFVIEKLGGTVEYVNAKSPIRASYGGRTVEFSINAKKMTILKSGAVATKTLDTAAVLKGGKTYIPLRAISESLGFDVSYDNATKIISVCNEKMSDAAKVFYVASGKNYIK